MSLIKKALLINIDFLKKYLCLSNLNANENIGFTSTLSGLRFTPYTRLMVPFSLGRTIRGVSYNTSFMLDPYGKLCIDIINGKDSQKIFHNLSVILHQEMSQTAADIINLTGNIKLMNYPAWAVVMPWEKISIEEKFEIYPESFYKNRSTKELPFENSSRLSIIETMYSSKSLESKVNQMQKLYKSIKRHGLKKNSNLPKINILIKEKEWRWFMGDAGNHRAYICACFGFKFFESRVSSIINKEEVNRWPNVINGTYSVEEAESIFDSYFDGFFVLRGVV